VLYCEIIRKSQSEQTVAAASAASRFAADIFEINIDARGRHMQQGLVIAPLDEWSTPMCLTKHIGRTACDL